MEIKLLLVCAFFIGATVYAEDAPLNPFNLLQVDPPEYHELENEFEPPVVEPPPDLLDPPEPRNFEPPQPKAFEPPQARAFEPPEPVPPPRGQYEPLEPKPIGTPKQNSVCNAECGKRGGSSSDKIVGGVDAQIDEFPWRCALYRRNFFSTSTSYICSCTVLSPYIIMTAAHCTDGTSARDLYVNAGDYDLSKTGETRNQMIRVSQKAEHESYNRNTYQNDISLLALSSPLDFSTNVKPACLPYALEGQDLAPTNVTASGWGARREGDSARPTVLQKLDNFPLITRQECEGYYPGQIYDGMICTYLPGKDTCQGDSGGSIDYNNDNKYNAIGIVSWGVGCAREKRPGVYTDVSKYLDWITARTGSTFCG